MTGLDLVTFFQTALYSTEDLPLVECLQSVGIKLDFIPLPRQHGGAFATEPQSVAPANDLGARFKQSSDHAVLTHVFNSGSAENAGLCPQDKIIALGGYACNDIGGTVEQTAYRHAHYHPFLPPRPVARDKHHSSSGRSQYRPAAHLPIDKNLKTGFIMTKPYF